MHNGNGKTEGGTSEMLENIMKLVALAAEKTAKASSNSASFFGFYQPKEPKMVQKNK